MNILHITDFHFSNKTPLLENVVSSIINALKENNNKIDIILFTGDLVDKGNENKFLNASTALFDELSNKLSVPKTNIIFCPGNHDINRDLIRPYSDYFKNNIHNNTDLNSLYSKRSLTYQDLLLPSKNYLDFIKQYHTTNQDFISDLYSIHYRKIENEIFAFVCINSAWLSNLDQSNGTNDNGNLVIPTAIFDEISFHLSSKQVKKKILLAHHPFEFLAEYNKDDIEDKIYELFDFVFLGHIHKQRALTLQAKTNGIFVHIAKASLNHSIDTVGCTMISDDKDDELSLSIVELTYNTTDNICTIGDPFIHKIPCSAERNTLNKLRQKIHDKLDPEISNANSLILSIDNTSDSFLDSFNSPVLKSNPDDESSYSLQPILEWTSLMDEKNYFIFGKDKCGKTSLLKRIQIEYIKQYTAFGKIPFYIDSREYEKKVDNEFHLDTIVRSYYGINKATMNDMISKGCFVFLIDNFVIDSVFSIYLRNYFASHANSKYIFCADYNRSANISAEIQSWSDISYSLLYFHNLRRKEIIQYTNKCLAKTKNKTDVQEKIIQLCRQMELPLNYWTISLLTVIHHKSSDTYSKNLFSILNICIDEIFDKKRLLFNKCRLSFEQLQNICAYIAQKLFIYHPQNVYSAKKESIINIINEIAGKNPRIGVVDSNMIFNFLCDCGIFKAKSDGTYTFRLNGFFEYFLALQMTIDEDFKNSILSNEQLYLAFKNQIEIYSGFRRDDEYFLNNIYERTKEKVSKPFASYTKKLDEILLEKIQRPQALEEFCKQLYARPLNSIEKAEIQDEIDEINPAAEVHLVKEYDVQKINSEIIGLYLSILARVFKNTDNITNYSLSLQIFRDIIQYYCYWSFYLIDECANIVKDEFEKDPINIDKRKELDMLKFISNFNPLIAQLELYEGIGHYNMSKMIKDEIVAIQKDIENNQYKLFVLYFLLLDIDVEENMENIDLILKNIKIPLLKYISKLKLNYYLAFQSEGKKTLQQKLSDSIQRINQLIDNNIDNSSIQKSISDHKKTSLIVSKNK